jgi:hypothetical protein
VTGWSRPIKALLFAILLVGIAGLGDRRQSMALFTAQVTSPPSTFQVGTLRMSNSRSGQALFTTSGAADGVATSTMSVVAASGTLAFVPGPVGSTSPNPLPTDPGFQVSGSGGVMPGMVLVNSVTIGNVGGTLAAGAVNLSVPSITVTNNAAAHCDASNALVVDGTDTCGRGRLTDVMRLTAFYRPTETQAVCVIGTVTPGTIVSATSDGAAIMACGGSGQSIASSTFGIPLGLPLTRNAAGTPGGQFALAPSSAPLTITGATTSGDRIEPALAAIPVWNFRDGAVVRDWAVGETRAVTFALSIDPIADNRYQGARATVNLQWDSTSLPGSAVTTVPSAPSGTGSVTGTLTSVSGSVDAQSVQLFPQGGSPISVQSGADGSFSFLNLVSGTYSVVWYAGSVPVVRSVTVTPGQASTVTLPATAIDRTVSVTITPSPSTSSPWAAYPMVSAPGSSQMSFGGQMVAVTTGTHSMPYRSSDAANTRLNLFAGSSGQGTAPLVQYSRSLSDLPSTLSVVVPTVTATTLTCSATACTTTVAITNVPDGSTVSAYLVPAATYYSSANPASSQGQAATSSMALTFAKPTDGSYTLMVYLNPAGSSAGTMPTWSWSLRGATPLTVASPAT